jgi:hypothetical protein
VCFFSNLGIFCANGQTETERVGAGAVWGFCRRERTMMSEVGILHQWPQEATGEPCRVCGEPANTIRDGKHYCAVHDLSHMRSTPIALCAIDGCGCPAVERVAGRELCRYHAPRLAA